MYWQLVYIPCSKGLGVRNLQYWIRFCQKSHNTVTDHNYNLSVVRILMKQTLYFNTRSETVTKTNQNETKIISFVFRPVIYSLIHFLDEKFHMCNGVKSYLNMCCIILQNSECITLTANTNLYRLISVLFRLRNILTTLYCT